MGKALFLMIIIFGFWIPASLVHAQNLRSPLQVRSIRKNETKKTDSSYTKNDLSDLFSEEQHRDLNRKVRRVSRKYQNQIQQLNIPFIQVNTYGTEFLELLPSGKGPELYGKLLCKAILKDVEVSLKTLIRKPDLRGKDKLRSHRIKTNLKVSHGDIFAQIDIPIGTGKQVATIKLNHEQMAMGSKFKWGNLTLRLNKVHPDGASNIASLSGTIYLDRKRR